MVSSQTPERLKWPLAVGSSSFKKSLGSLQSRFSRSAWMVEWKLSRRLSTLAALSVMITVFQTPRRDVARCRHQDAPHQLGCNVGEVRHPIADNCGFPMQRRYGLPGWGWT
jgi:hypothetical protein